MKKYTKAALILAGFLSVSLFSGCQKEQQTGSVSDIKVETVTAETGTLEISTDYIGTLSPNLTVDVIPLVAGNVKSVPVKVGDKVKAGDLLCQLDDTSASLSVKSAEDAVDSAKAGKEAAESQAGSARVQAQANVKTMERTLEGYKDSLKTAEKQLEKLKGSKKNIQKAQTQAQKAYAATKARYKAAQKLYIQFQAFLEANPDCRTTAGLTAAASAVSQNPQDYTVNIPPTTAQGSGSAGGNETAAPTAPTGDNVPAGSANNEITSGAGSQDLTADPGASQQDSGISQQESAAAAVAKQKQAKALLSALTKTGLTVEYLSSTGINSLSEDATDGETAYNSAASGLSQLETSISTLKTNIGQLKGQISTTEESLKTAKKLAKYASSGSEVYDAQIEAAETGVDAAKYQKDLYRLTSPIDGVVDAVNVQKDGMAAQGYAAFTISEKESMKVTFYVTEDVRNFLKPGDEVSLYKKDDDEKVEDLGHITFIGTTVDPQKGLFKVEAEVVTSGQKELVSGTNVKLSIVSSAISGEIMIPYDAVYYDDGQAYTYKVTDGQAARADIETGLFNEDMITVVSGLNVGDSIITTWASGLKDGAEVTIIHGEDAE